MKFGFAALLLLATSAEVEATKLKSQAQMMAEIEAMSMNANMHQVSMREKTLLKTYLEVDMNEYLQQKMDSELFEGVSEKEKSEFIGNFFHFVKCRFSDCNLLQTKSKLNTHKKSESPTGAESKKIEDSKEVEDWGSGKGNHTPAYNEQHLAQTNSTSNVTLQANSSKKANASSPTGAESKAIEDKKNVEDWGSGKGNHVPAFNENHNVQLAQTNATSNATADRKAKMVTNTFPQVEKALAAEKAQLLLTPDQASDNKKDAEPTNVQIKAEIKK